MDFEKLGSFYLGKEYDLEKGQVVDRLAMYDAKDLTTHAVCVGMTGSGKTGLCIGLLEEAAIDRVPALIIDPKGDLTNLLLTFPGLKPSDFRPWINPDDAQRKGQTLDQAATSQAALWKKGLAQWGQDPSRIQKLRDSVDFRIFTPGSDAGLPVSLVQSFNAPQEDWDDNAESLRERITGMVSSLLGLAGIDADPMASREHTLLASIFEHYWRKGENLDFAKLILAIETPPIRRLGVFDVDTFFPHKDRFKLALTLNNIIASPSFQSWLTGQPLDIADLLTSPDGRVRHSIFYIAHLNDEERMFFVAMLLNQFLGWVRTQPGTTSLRALLYMDEIFGFLPPVANPPSKRPLLTLLKQARAFGVGLVLATQNPVDLDYKALTNAGTWFIGRLQTERDKMRVLEGLESASSQAGQALDKQELSGIISSLDKRVFLLHNVHEDAPILFNTRWVMSYLRGPMTRRQIRQLKETFPLDTRPKAASDPAAAGSALPVGLGEAGGSQAPPLLDAGISQAYLAVRKPSGSAAAELDRAEGRSPQHVGEDLVYQPFVCGIGRVRFVNTRRGIDHKNEYALLAEAPEGLARMAWEDAERQGVRPNDLERQPQAEARFSPLPETINETSEWKALAKGLRDHLYTSSSLPIFYNAVFKAYSSAGESASEFQLRLNHLAREKRDAEVEKLRRQYDRKLRQLDTRVDKARLALQKKKATASARTRETLVSVGETLLGVFLGRRRSVSSSLSKYRMSSSAKVDAEAAEENVEGLVAEIEKVRQELEARVEAIQKRWDAAVEKLEEKAIKPRRQDVEVDFMGLLWRPYWRFEEEDGFGGRLSRFVDASGLEPLERA